MKPIAIVLVVASFVVACAGALRAFNRDASQDPVPDEAVRKAARAEAERLWGRARAERRPIDGRMKELHDILDAQARRITDLEKSVASLKDELMKATVLAATAGQGPRRNERLQDMALRTIGQVTVQQVMAGRDDFLNLIRDSADLPSLAAVDAQFRLQRYKRSGKLSEASQKAVGQALAEGNGRFLAMLQETLRSGKAPNQQEILDWAEQIWKQQDEALQKSLPPEEYQAYQREARAERGQARVLVSFAFPANESAENR